MSSFAFTCRNNNNTYAQHRKLQLKASIVSRRAQFISATDGWIDRIRNDAMGFSVVIASALFGYAKEMFTRNKYKRDVTENFRFRVGH